MIKNIDKLKVCRAVACVLLLAVLVTACSVRGTDDFDPNDKYTDDVVTTAGTFSGTFRIKTEASDSLTLDPSSSVSSVRADAMLARYDEVAALFNCTISAQQVKSGNIMSTMMASTAAARNYADIFQLSAANIYEMYKGGYLTYAQKLEDFDISSEKWGYAGHKEMMTFSEGKTYAFRNTYWAAPIASVSGVLYYNENLLVKNSAPMPYEFYENDQWTWANFREICLMVTQHIEDEQGTYAFATPTADYPAFINAAINSNGGERLVKNADGTYSCGYTSWNTINALQWATSLVQDDKLTYNLREDTKSTLDIEAFVNFYTVFLVANSSVGVSEDESFPLYTFEGDFRWIEFPRGVDVPTSEGVTSAYYSEADQFLALSNTVDTGVTGKILNALFEPLASESETGWQEYLKKNYFFHETDFEIYNKMISYAKTDGSILTQNTNMSTNDIFAGVINGVKTPKEAVEQLAPVVEGLLG